MTQRLNGSAAPAVALEVRHISKRHGAITALSDVAMTVCRGEVHGLVGGNGAGKSSLVKILAGVSLGEPGGILRVGRREIDASQTSPSWATEAGLRFVHQDLGVFPNLSVTENLLIGHGFPHGRGGRIRWEEAHAHARRVLGAFSVEIDPRRTMAELSAADRTLVAIARALQDDAAELEAPGEEPPETRVTGGEHIIVLDEPTASLPLTESRRLLEEVRALAGRGHAVVLVTHRLDELVSAADRVTVLRDGHHAGELVKGGDGDAVVTEPNMIRLISGHDSSPVVSSSTPPKRPSSATATRAREAASRSRERLQVSLLSVHGLSVGPLDDVSFDLQPGEVVGVAGLLGSGRSCLLRAIAGVDRIRSGQLTLEGSPYRPPSLRHALKLGVAYVPADRSRDGVFADLSVRENLTAGRLRPYWRRAALSGTGEARAARSLIERYRVRCASDQQPIATLSGGNQQKVVMARSLNWVPRLLLLDEPSHGVDVTARIEIHQLVREATEAGAAALIVSSDLEELASVSDRVLVVGRGRLVGELVGPAITVPNMHRGAFGSLQETP